MWAKVARRVAAWVKPPPGQPLATEQPHQPQQGSAPQGASQLPKPRSLGQVGASMGGWASRTGAAHSPPATPIATCWPGQNIRIVHFALGIWQDVRPFLCRSGVVCLYLLHLLCVWCVHWSVIRL